MTGRVDSNRIPIGSIWKEGDNMPKTSLNIKHEEIDDFNEAQRIT